MLTLLAALGLCAVCTFLLRYLPIYLEKYHRGRRLPDWCQAGLQALGPAAISALVVISFLPLLSAEDLSLSSLPDIEFFKNSLPVFLACFSIWLVDRVSQNVIFACFSGVFIYGVTLYLLSG